MIRIYRMCGTLNAIVLGSFEIGSILFDLHLKLTQGLDLKLTRPGLAANGTKPK